MVTSLTLQGPKGQSLAVQARPHLPKDLNQNGVLEDSELLADLAEQGYLREGADQAQLLKEYKAGLTGKPQEIGLQQQGYHTYEQVGQALADLAERFPGKAERVSLGKSAEGREIWALRVGTPDENNPKPGVVITGCHHAREWMTVEVPIHTARTLLESYDSDADSRRRVDQSVTWFVPLVNPDGYEYSRTKDSWWRKTRRAIEETGCPGKKGDFGVDANRNYWDSKPEHYHLWRPDGDTPCSTFDDFGGGRTSDNPRRDTYRGPEGASEPEVQALLGLELDPKNNVKGVLDYHSYGEMILYPYGHTEQPPERLQDYLDIGGKMNQQLGNRYRLQPSIDLYPTSGGSNDIHEANGIFGMTFEIGRSFQPDPAEIPRMTAYITPANLVFIDEVARRFPQAPLQPPSPPGPQPQP